MANNCNKNDSKYLGYMDEKGTDDTECSRKVIYRKVTGAFKNLVNLR